MIKIKLKSHHRWLGLIFLISLFLRFYQLDQLPRILNRDEAALAYNAYLINQTGQDEWQRYWPTAFESFGDYKLPGYIYSVSILFSFMPLQDWVVRLPSALAGAILPIIGYYFMRRLNFRRPWAMLLALMLATTPVFFFFSRMAFEANLALTLFFLGLTLLLLKPSTLWSQLGGVVLLIFAIFTYNSPLIVLPFIILALIYWHVFWQPRKWWLSALLLIGVGLVAGWQLTQLADQKSGITIFQDETTWMKQVEFRQNFNQVWQQNLLGNRYVFYGLKMAGNYYLSFRPDFLIDGIGGHPWHSIPQGGHLILVTYIFMIVGMISSLYYLLVNYKNRHSFLYKRRLLIIYLLIISLIPAVITVDAPHATRSLFALVMMVVISLVGVKDSYHFFRDNSQIKKPAFALIFIIVCTWQSGSYFYKYFTQYPLTQQILRPGLSDTLKQLDENYPTDQVAVVDGDGYDYILFAWYDVLSPTEFFQSVVRQQPDKIGFKYGQQVSRYHFIAHESDRNQDESLVVKWTGKAWEIVKY